MVWNANILAPLCLEISLHNQVLLKLNSLDLIIVNCQVTEMQY